MPRKVLNGAKLAEDVARMLGADKTSPPEAHPSLMDAVRALAGYIETRTKLRWTDAMVAKVLTEAGYPIGEATLRSYRKRLRDEGLMMAVINAPAGRPPEIAEAPAVPIVSAPSVAMMSSIAEVDEPSAPPSPVSTGGGVPNPDLPDQPAPRPRSTGQPPPPRTFVVNIKNLPPDRA